MSSFQLLTKKNTFVIAFTFNGIIHRVRDIFVKLQQIDVSMLNAEWHESELPLD